MTDSGGASFSLMYLPNGNAGDLPTVTGPVIPVTAIFLAAIGLSSPWTLAGNGILCAVYAIGATPASEAAALAPSNFNPNYSPPLYRPYLGKNPTDLVNSPSDVVMTPLGPAPNPSGIIF